MSIVIENCVKRLLRRFAPRNDTVLNTINFMPRPLLIIIVVIAIVLKFALFIFAEIHYPQSKFLPDSRDYLQTGQVLVSRGAFAQKDAQGVLHAEFRRTPGYPAFLGVLYGLMGIPLDGIILAQVLLSVLTAFFVYETVLQIDPSIAFLGAGIILFSPVAAVFFLIILTETLFLFFIALFMLQFVRYLKSGEIKFLAGAALMLVLASYVRPATFYLGLGIYFFVIYANVPKDIKKAIGHALIFGALVYGLLGIWQLRNYLVFKNAVFCSILQENYGFQVYGIVHGLLALMTSPGSFKYFHCPALTIIGKVIGYPWVVFWMIGLIYGIVKAGRNHCYQFLVFVLFCFIYGSLAGAMPFLSERFRLPMEPLIAILSAYGWKELMVFKKGFKIS